MSRFAFLSAGLVFAFGGCVSSVVFAEGEGAGLLGTDRSPPEGVETFPRPEWRVGDRFTFRRGGQLRLDFTVTDRSETGYLMKEATTGIVNQVDLDLGHLGQELEGAPELARQLSPVDPRYSWPLWVGKRWHGEYFRKLPNGEMLPVIVRYHCDGRETIEVAAGQLDCLRIWRSARPAIDGDYLDQVELVWFAPQVGYVARRLIDGVATELESFQRQ